jgi:hypothetical protein
MDELVCKECKKSIPQSSVDTDLNFALCPICDCGFDLNSLSQEQMSLYPSVLDPSSIDLPANLRFDAHSSRLTIKEEKTKAGSNLNSTVHLIIWILLLAYWWLKTTRLPSPETLEWESLFFVLPITIFYSAVLVVMLVIGIHRRFSYHELSIENKNLLLRTLPFKVPFDKIFPTDDMDTIYARAHDMGVRVGRETTWEIRVMNKDGKSHRLIYQVDNRKQALFFIRYYLSECGLWP